MILGLRTAIYPAPDLTEGKRFYSAVLGVEPYYDETFYVGYSVGGFELGLIPDGVPGADGTHIHWGVADIDAELLRLHALGAREHYSSRDVGGGIKVAAVLDPFGNVFALIENPAFDLKALR